MFLVLFPLDVSLQIAIIEIADLLVSINSECLFAFVVKHLSLREHVTVCLEWTWIDLVSASFLLQG